MPGSEECCVLSDEFQGFGLSSLELNLLQRSPLQAKFLQTLLLDIHATADVVHSVAVLGG